MFLVYGVFYVLVIAFISIFTRVIGGFIMAMLEYKKEQNAQQNLLKMDPNSKEYLSRYMPKA